MTHLMTLLLRLSDQLSAQTSRRVPPVEVCPGTVKLLGIVIELNW